MKQYLDLCKKVLDEGIRKKNRTGIDHIGYTGDMMQFDLSKGFPAVTTKKLFWKASVAEMLGFLRGYSNASDFRNLGCKVWDANANENQSWLNNPNRKGHDDLGRIYGVQARDWKDRRLHFTGDEPPKNIDEYTFLMTDEAGDTGYNEILMERSVDQLKNVYNDLKQGIDNRREIVTHWNPSELDQMALPPCHMFYQFGIQGEYLNLSMYQRSCDVPLGVPFNIFGYAWLLSVMAQITGHKVGILTHFLHDIHIYENQVELMKVQLEREPLKLPTLKINPDIKTLEDLENWVTVDDFELENYNCHEAIKYPFAV